MPTYKQENRPVRIKTPFGEDALLVKSLAGTERLGRPFQYELVLASEGHELDYKKIIGQNVTVFVDKGDKEPRFFNGFISRFAQTKFERKLAEYHATVVPWLWFLTRSSDCRIFQNLTIPEILKQVFEDHGFSDIIDRLHGSYRKWDYCVQYRETGYAFISRLMEEEGIYYYFKHEDGKHSMVLCDSPVSHKQFAGYEDLLYRPTASTTQETLTAWVVQHEVQTAGYVTADFDFTTPKRNPLANSFRERSHGHSQLEQFDYLGEQSPFSEGERYSKLRLEEGQARHETYSGEGDARGICTGVRFVLKGHPRKEFEKEYLTTGAEYLIHCNSHETADALGDDFKYHSKMTAMLLDDQFRTPRETPKPIVHGPQTAIVVGPASEKIYTDQYGRVKVQFHWDRRGKKDENSSCWVRVSQAWAGKNWGDMAIPHIGDEVIVECLEGDPDRPIITGRVYNQASMPPLGLPANKHKRILQDDYGSKLIFDATPGDEHIRLHSPHHNSGITLGRSTTGITESNNIQTTYGNNVAYTKGTAVGLTFGAAVVGVLGVNTAFVLGGNYSCNVATQLSINIGPQYSLTIGAKSEYNEDDSDKIVEGNVVISSGQVLNLVGGAGGAQGTSIMRAADDLMELTVGDGENVTPSGLRGKWSPFVKYANIASLLLPAGGAIWASQCSKYVDNYNAAKYPGGKTDQTADDHDVEGEKNATDAQDKLTNGAMIYNGACAAAMFIVQMIARGVRTTTVPPLGKGIKARLKLDRVAEAAILEGAKAVNLFGNAKGSSIALDDKGVTIASGSGAVDITSGTTGISIKGTEIKISGASVQVTGKLDFADGALTIMGTAVPLASKLAAIVAKAEAADKAATAGKVAHNAGVTAKRTAPPPPPRP